MPEPCTIAVAHQKGGVGKTTTTLLLAHEIADLRPDWRVLVEDLELADEARAIQAESDVLASSGQGDALRPLAEVAPIILAGQVHAVLIGALYDADDVLDDAAAVGGRHGSRSRSASP